MICMTCRSSYEIDARFDFNSVELRAFTPGQIKIFFENWFRSDERKAKLILEFLARYPHIQEAASSPMVATVLATITQYDRELPKTYAELYAERFDLLLERWDRGKKVIRNVYDKKDKLAVLQDLAFSNGRN